MKANESVRQANDRLRGYIGARLALLKNGVSRGKDPENDAVWNETTRTGLTMINDILAQHDSAAPGVFVMDAEALEHFRYLRQVAIDLLKQYDPTFKDEITAAK